MKISTFLLSMLFALWSILANAALYDRGNGMIYDSVQNITWLQNANLIASLQPGDPGYFDWGGANYWANNLIYGGFDDWRLPSAKPDILRDIDIANNYDYGDINSELGYLFFIELGNKAKYDEVGNLQFGYGLLNTSFFDYSTGNLINFINFNNYGNGYWLKENISRPVCIPGLRCNWEEKSFVFLTDVGALGPSANGYGFMAIAVRDGDVIPQVPIPAAAWLMGSGLLCMVGFFRRKN